jgi:class 3 adenylate cyclase
LEAAIAGLEAQRAVLGEGVVEAALGPLRRQLAELRQAQLSTPAENPPLQAPLFEGERKIVTILFADISGFTAMSETMDPEQVRGLMNACFDDLAPAIHKYQGTINKFIGDEIMALFGAPIAHENDAERALRAALEMVTRLRDFNTRHQTDLGLHFGINTGLVIAGSIGAQQQQQYDVMGDAVNIASRLESESERGEIFVGPDTYRLTSPLFDFETLAPVRMKGKSAPVPVYRLLREKARPGRVRGLIGLESAMVGRAGPLAALLKAVDSLAEGRGAAVAVIGEAGLGKSRLVAEWKARLADEGRLRTDVTAQRPPSSIFVAEGQCLSYGQSLPYHLVAEALKSLRGVSPSSSSIELEAILRELIGSLSVDGYAYLAHLLSLPLAGRAQQQIGLLDPEALRAHYLASLRELLGACAERGPLVLVLEDLHWADPASVDLLIELLPLTHRAPILFCALSRPDRDQPGWRWIGAAAETLAERFSAITLAALTEADSRQLVANLLEIETLPEPVRHVILRRAEGNPLFVEEVIRMLIDRGSLAKRGERWVAVQDIETADIPDNLNGLLMARIDRLSEEAKRTLRVAAVIGRQFSARVLEQVVKE